MIEKLPGSESAVRFRPLSDTRLGRGEFPARVGSRARVALLTPYFPFFDGIFPDEYRVKQLGNARALAELISAAGFEVHHHGLTDSSELAVEHGKLLAAADPQVLVVAPVMAAPGTHSLPAVEIVDRPTVICQVVRRATIDTSYTEFEATEDSTLLGAIMACAGLRKHGRPFVHVMMSTSAQPNELIRTLRGAIAAEGLASKTIGVVGATLEGYVDVEISSEQLAELGLRRVDINGSELIDQFEGVTEADALARAATIAAQDVAFEVEPATIVRDLKLTVALERLAAAREIDALALNCHGEVFRRGTEVGIPACLGGSLLASAECPVTCTGDISTIIALMVGQQFSGDVLYCEPYTFEYDTGRVILGSCGIGTIPMASPAHPARVCGNYGYPGCQSNGACVRFGVQAGPATMLAYVPGGSSDDGSGYVVWMTGEITGDFHAEMHGPNATLKLDCPDPRSALSRWTAAGPAHHVALVAADISTELVTMSQLSRVKMIRIN